MENINDYLFIILALVVFYFLLMVYLKYGYKQTTFTPVESSIPDIEQKPKEINVVYTPNIYETEDTRMKYPLLPPVNPMARNRTIKDVIPASTQLYNSQPYESTEYLLDTPPDTLTNELVYSGGDTQLISVPLQYNYPYDETLRAQDILITPYNKVKFGTC